MQIKSSGRYFLILALLLLLNAPAKAQGNLQYTDDRRIHFGFLLGTHFSDFRVNLSYAQLDGKVYEAQVSNLTPGFCAGIISDLRINRYFNLRVTPTIYFGERTLKYKVAGHEATHDERIYSIPMALPVYIKYSAERHKNYRPYIIGGAGAYVDFGRDQEKNVLLNLFDTYVEFGLGCDIYFPYFKLAPELKFAFGLNNCLVPYEKRKQGFIDPIYTQSLSGLTNRWITLSFNFE